MPKYIVIDTNILHGREGDKVAKLYGPGDRIELTEEEAAKLGALVEPVKKAEKEKE